MAGAYCLGHHPVSLFHETRPFARIGVEYIHNCPRLFCQSFKNILCLVRLFYFILADIYAVHPYRKSLHNVIAKSQHTFFLLKNVCKRSCRLRCIDDIQRIRKPFVCHRRIRKLLAIFFLQHRQQHVLSSKKLFLQHLHKHPVLRFV